jgi:hypothetical protein
MIPEIILRFIGFSAFLCVSVSAGHFYYFGLSTPYSQTM